MWPCLKNNNDSKQYQSFPQSAVVILLICLFLHPKRSIASILHLSQDHSLPSNHSVFTVQKNKTKQKRKTIYVWFSIHHGRDGRTVCFRVISPSDFSPWVDFPPVPLWCVKLPLWPISSPGPSLGKDEPVEIHFFSLVLRAWIFPTVWNSCLQTAQRRRNPRGWPSTWMLKNTVGFDHGWQQTATEDSDICKVMLDFLVLFVFFFCKKNLIKFL